MSSKACACLIAVAAVCSIQARDLKADLTGLAPSGKTMRLAYSKGGPPAEWCDPTGAAVYTVSSNEGVLRKIYPAGTAVANIRCVSMTDDGTRVVFYDSGPGNVVVVNYDGTNVTKFSAPNMYDYWINPSDKSEWVIVSENNDVVRINLNKPTDPKVVVVSQARVNALPALISDAGCGGISDDGLKVVLTKEVSNGSIAGIVTAATGAFAQGFYGCWPQMRSGTPIQMSQNVGINHSTVSGHRGPTIFSETGAEVQHWNTSDTLDAWLKKNTTYDQANNGCWNMEEGHSSEGLRWLRDRNYFSVTPMRSKVGPILWRATDNKWTYIEDNLDCTYAGDLDGVVGTFPFVGTLRQPESRHAGVARQAQDSKAYSLDGRLIARASRGNVVRSGVVVSQSGNGTMRRVCRSASRSLSNRPAR